MAKIFVDQTCLRIILNTGVDITGALDQKIYYRKPDGTVDSLDAYVQDPSPEGIIYVDLDSDSTLLDTKGAWKFWAWIEFSDGRTARGETVGITIWSEDE